MQNSFKFTGLYTLVLSILLTSITSTIAAARPAVELRLLGTYATGIFNAGAAEIVAHDPLTQRLFVVNGANSAIDVLDVSDPSTPVLLFSIDIEVYGDQANSVDVCNGLVAAAVQADVKTDNGTVEFFDANGVHLKSVPAGALPDMLTFTPNCERVLAANEGEPSSYNQVNSVDPVGSVTVVDLRNGVANATSNTIGFGGLTIDPGVRIFGPNATAAQDLEPEYIAVDHNSQTAWITLQENNAIAIFDILSETFTDVVPLGLKNHSLSANKLDASDRDGPGGTAAINIVNWPVFGMYQPDAIASIKYRNDTFLITANEGDARDYPGFVEEIRVGSASYLLDSVIFPNAASLKTNAQIGRLNVSRASGNTDGGADYEEIHVFGARSFSIWTAAGEQVYDSGDDIEQLTASLYPNNFNASSTSNAPDDRSDNKGPEPEAVTVGKAYGRTYAFIGLERIGGILVYDVTDPYDVQFIQYLNNRNFTAAVNTSAAGDLGPEGVHFIAEDDSPTGVPLIAVANEVSGTTTVYEFVQAD